METFYKLRPTANHYDWGREMSSSLVYRLYKQHLPDELNDNPNVGVNKRYSELWIGTHPSGHSVVIPSKYLDKIPDRNVIYLQNLLKSLSTVNKSTDSLNILVKVLSIDKPLSLQLHPDEDNIDALLECRCKSIVDRSSKPEMCIALTEFKAISGLKSLDEIKGYLDKYNEFSIIIGDEIINDIKMNGNKGEIYIKIIKRLLLESYDCTEMLLNFIKLLQNSKYRDISEDYVLVMYKNYGLDKCILFPLIMGCIQMNSGDALFIPPNTLHSYISGDCIEIMKTSDNVVRCGLTNKVKDINACLMLLEYQLTKDLQSCCTINIIKPINISKFIFKYHPIHSSCNFLIYSIIIPSNESDNIILDILSLAIIINTNENVVLNIKSNDLQVNINESKNGDCYLFLPNTSIYIQNSNDDNNNFIMYIAQELI